MSAIVRPDPRLLSAVPYLTPGGRCIDVGTDHAYLPIYLVSEGIVSHAMACDINRGPLESAKEHILAAGLENQIETFLTDGLQGLEGFGADDVMIFGMGGELIIKILSEAPWVQNSKIGLILQPMSRANLLRKYLVENGFEILGETLSKSGKIYQTVHARFCGERSTYNEEELLLGRRNIECNPSLFAEFVAHELKVAKRVQQGKALSATACTREDERIIEILTKRLESLL